MSSKFRKTLKICLIISSVLAFIFIEIYRFIVYQSNTISDFHLADMAANFFGLFPLNFLFWMISGKTSKSYVYAIPLAIAFGFFIYEFIQMFMSSQTFDKLDIIATFIAMVICIIINLFLFRRTVKK